MAELIKFFKDISYKDISKVGGKNASLGEMFNQLNQAGIHVPDGYATTAEAYWLFLDHNKLRKELTAILQHLNVKDFDNLSEVGSQAREKNNKLTPTIAAKKFIS